MSFMGLFFIICSDSEKVVIFIVSLLLRSTTFCEIRSNVAMKNNFAYQSKMSPHLDVYCYHQLSYYYYYYFMMLFILLNKLELNCLFL